MKHGSHGQGLLIIGTLYWFRTHDTWFVEQRRSIAKLETAHGEEGEEGDTDGRTANYTYEDMIDRVTGILHTQSPDLIKKKRHIMKPP